ncbi:hypothetical protein BIY22_06235 [Vibrio panuliri]|uniref:DUF4432 domain-containing protein n=2 Tax=Vibrio panuliri TaxID=1381081 RepID=A0A1Q9HJR7_9VIBR|nr:hypothetical protein BIY22_06235 [Vibrio panuliri]
MTSFDFDRLTRKELMKRIGDISQVAGVTQSTVHDGEGYGVRICDVKTASGLRFTVLPDRCMDIFDMSYKGIPLSPISKTGLKNPESYNSQGFNWLRQFYCGLLTTCGLDHVGPPTSERGLHGFASNTRAKDVSVEQTWQGEVFTMRISGTIKQATMFGENIELRRTISLNHLADWVEIEDQVTNLAFQPQKIELLYHVNFGFPLLDTCSEMILPTTSVVPRDCIAQQNLKSSEQVSPPQCGYQEQVYFHQANESATVELGISNPELGLKFSYQYENQSLPCITQWNQFGAGDYVLGLESGTAYPASEADPTPAYSRLVLAPFETKTIKLKFKVEELPC